jgi:integrase
MPIEPRNFNRSWNARCAKAGVRKITVHDGRRTCATLLVDLDVLLYRGPTPRPKISSKGL